MPASVVYLIHLASRPERNRAVLRTLDVETQGPVRWLFLGEDFRLALSWEQAMGARFERLDISRQLSETADALRQPFFTWLDALNSRYGSDPHWWFAQLAERNTLISPLFLFMCYLAVASKCFAGEQPPRLVVAQSWGLIRTLRALGRTLGLEMRVGAPWRRHIDLFR